MGIETDQYKLKLLSEKCFGPVVIYISNEQFGNAGEMIMEGVGASVKNPFTFYELLVKDWDRNLTPWESGEIIKNRDFKGQASVLLKSIETRVIPEIKKQVGEEKIYLAGYSLAGLFALFSIYESDWFDGAACCSGSLWYPGWLEYALEHKLKRGCSVYLSLGKNEKNTKHPIMKKVEENMKQQYELLQQDCGVDRLHMDWHEGGHFSDTRERMEMGIGWLVSGIEE